jgi:hypothetical protein
MATVRRDFLKFAAGAGAGLVCSPLPWRLVGDSALWSQNWSWIPKTPRGEISYQPTACTLCPAGCAVRARCCGSQPVSLWGAGDPLCPAGLCGHHLAFHPARLREALHGNAHCRPEQAFEAAQKIVSDAGSKGSVAVLDLRPGRTASILYRKHLARLGGRYLTISPTIGPTLAALAHTADRGAVPAFDLDRTSILLSIGTPVLEAWGAPGRMLNPERKFKLWQAEARQSATALGAERWFRIRPGAETAFAAGLIAAIDGDRATLRRAATLAGIGEDELSAAAQELLKTTAVVVADTHPVLGPPAQETLRAVACLNSRLRAIGRPGGIIARAETPIPSEWGPLAAETPLRAVPDGSLQLLFIDDSTPGAPLPWKWIAAKLAPGAPVITASWTRSGVARQSHYALPAIAYLEGLQDVPTPPDASVARFALSLPLVGPTSGAIEPVEWFGRLAGDATPLAARLKERAAAIQSGKRGAVRSHAGEMVTPDKLATADTFWGALAAGARWTDAPSRATLSAKGVSEPPFALEATPEELTVVPTAWFGADVSPLMTKLWVESDLKPSVQLVYLHPETAQRLALADGASVRLESACGACRVEVRVDDSVQTGALEMAASHAWLALGELKDGAWRAAATRVVRL